MLNKRDTKRTAEIAANWLKMKHTTVFFGRQPADWHCRYWTAKEVAA